MVNNCYHFINKVREKLNTELKQKIQLRVNEFVSCVQVRLFTQQRTYDHAFEKIFKPQNKQKIKLTTKINENVNINAQKNSQAKT